MEPRTDAEPDAVVDAHPADDHPKHDEQQLEAFDDAEGFDIGPLDWVLALLTLPLLFWALMYAVTGGEGMFATRRARYRLYAILLGIEAVIVAGFLWWLL